MLRANCADLNIRFNSHSHADGSNWGRVTIHFSMSVRVVPPQSMNFPVPNGHIGIASRTAFNLQHSYEKKYG